MRSLILIAAVTLQAASFDCTKTTTPVERTICASKELSDLDEHLGRYYQAARVTLGAGAVCLRTDQAQWLKEVRNRCADAACLRKAYLARLGELDALQPGATAVKGIDLPFVPALVWTVPPAADTTAFPANVKASPLEARGAITRSDGDGFLIGNSTVLVMDMAVEPATATQLESLAKERTTQFLARGFAASQSQGRRVFEPSRCVFVYRLLTRAAP